MNEDSILLGKEQLMKCKYMQNLVATLQTPKLNIPSNPDMFSALLNSIIGQQLSTASANSIRNKFYNYLKTDKPSPGLLLSLDDLQYSQNGLSQQKRSYLRNVANFFEENKTFIRELQNMKDQELIENLTKIKGVGIWTAQMLLIFTLGRTNVFPILDLAILQSGAKLLAIESKPLKEQKTILLNKSLDWEPYKSLASLYLWSWRDNQYKL